MGFRGMRGIRLGRDLAGRVLRRGLDAKHHLGCVVLAGRAQVLGKARGVAQAQHKYAGRVRVECAGMPHPLGAKQLARHAHHVMRGHARRFINHDDAMNGHR